MARVAIGWLAVLAFLAAGPRCPQPKPTGPYPIVLAHGALGMESYGPLSYWYGIVSALEAEGAEVYVTEVSPIHSSWVRGQQLLEQIEDIVATSGRPKVNIIGHSQGGLDARYVAGTRPELVASVTTVGSPHRGAELAEFVVDGILADGSLAWWLVDAFGLLVGDVLHLLTGTSYPIDARDALLQFTSPTIDAFNDEFPSGLPEGCGEGEPEVDGVRYFSWTGDGVLTNLFDPTDGVLALTSAIYGFEPNDGVVSVCSAHFGDVIADNYWMNHLDEVNQIAGLVQLFEVDPVTLYVEHLERLRGLGL